MKLSNLRFLKKATMVVFAATVALPSLSFCATWTLLKGKGPIAIVSYSLNKSIVLDGDPPSNGPRVMQSEEKYYAPYKACLNVLWKEFLDSSTAVFTGG